MGVRGGGRAPRNLADQLTLIKPRGVRLYPLHYCQPPRIQKAIYTSVVAVLHMYDNDLHATCFLYVKERNNDLKIRSSVFSKKQWLVKTGSSF